MKETTSKARAVRGMLRGPGMALLLLSSASLGWGGSVYVSTQSKTLGTIDLTTGQYTQIPTNGPGSFDPGSMNGLNFNNGTLYGNHAPSSYPTLWTLNQPSTGVVCSVGTPACNQEINLPNAYIRSGGMPNGAFYGLAQVASDGFTNEHLFLQNYSTGVGTEIGSTGLGFNNFYVKYAMAGDGSNLFLSAQQHFGINFDTLYGINTSTGAATAIAGLTGLSSGEMIDAMFFDSGTMYAFVSGGGVLKLETLDTSTGALTLALNLGSTNFGQITAAAVDPGSEAPEPATFALIGGGLAGLLTLRRRHNVRL